MRICYSIPNRYCSNQAYIKQDSRQKFPKKKIVMLGYSQGAIKSLLARSFTSTSNTVTQYKELYSQLAERFDLMIIWDPGIGHRWKRKS